MFVRTLKEYTEQNEKENEYVNGLIIINNIAMFF